MIRVDDDGFVWFKGKKYKYETFRYYSDENRYPDGTPHGLTENKTVWIVGTEYKNAVEYRNFYDTYYTTGTKK